MTHSGLIANLISATLVSLLIMPMAVLSLIAMPFGLEAWPLRAMGLGIELMVGAGEWWAPANGWRLGRAPSPSFPRSRARALS
jgi:competence protein ComEC